MSMSEQDSDIQKQLHDAIENALHRQGQIKDGTIVTGWIICWEASSMEDHISTAGQFYGPREMTTWKAMGLIEWVRKFCLHPPGFYGLSDDEEDE